MTDKEMYELLCRKAENIKLHLNPADVQEIANRFRELSSADVVSREQWNQLYADNLLLRCEVQRLKDVNARVMCTLHNLTDCCEVD